MDEKLADWKASTRVELSVVWKADKMVLKKAEKMAVRLVGQ